MGGDCLVDFIQKKKLEIPAFSGRGLLLRLGRTWCGLIFVALLWSCDLDAKFLRKIPQTLGTYPEHPQVRIWKDSLHQQVVKGLGISGVCSRGWLDLGWQVLCLQKVEVANNSIPCEVLELTLFVPFLVHIFVTVLNLESQWCFMYSGWPLVSNFPVNHARIISPSADMAESAKPFLAHQLSLLFFGCQRFLSQPPREEKKKHHLYLIFL